MRIFHPYKQTNVNAFVQYEVSSRRNVVLFTEKVVRDQEPRYTAAICYAIRNRSNAKNN
jgi:hypothetical protein